jgi:hypothetical protein
VKLFFRKEETKLKSQNKLKCSKEIENPSPVHKD